MCLCACVFVCLSVGLFACVYLRVCVGVGFVLLACSLASFFVCLCLLVCIYK